MSADLNALARKILPDLTRAQRRGLQLLAWAYKVSQEAALTGIKPSTERVLVRLEAIERFDTPGECSRLRPTRLGWILAAAMDPRLAEDADWTKDLT